MASFSGRNLINRREAININYLDDDFSIHQPQVYEKKRISIYKF